MPQAKAALLLLLHLPLASVAEVRPNGDAPAKVAEERADVSARSGPVRAIPDEDRAIVEAHLGPGVLGAPVPAPKIDDPARFFALAPADRLYRIVSGENAGELQSVRFFSELSPEGRASWRYRAGDEEMGFLVRLADGSLVMAGVEDFKSASVTRYDPPEPFLPKGIAPGEERRSRMAVSVYPKGDLRTASHRGALAVNYRYLGAHRFAAPAGVYDAVVMKSIFDGHIGPAHLQDTQYRFFAPGVGLLASIEIRRVSAFLLYQSDMRVARVLVEPAKTVSLRGD
jgi:hypothetical protein